MCVACSCLVQMHSPHLLQIFNTEQILKKKTHQAYFPRILIPSEFVLYWGSLFCKRLLTMGVNTPGLACKHTYGKWRNSKILSLAAATNIFQDFQVPWGARGNKVLEHLQWILQWRSIPFLSLRINEILQSLQRISCLGRLRKMPIGYLKLFSLKMFQYEIGKESSSYLEKFNFH